MASLIPGYNYDIFISYRQKDNKGEKWVSEFVEALKTELESTFKEEVSVYFDINPHDGLLETHDVEESLKEKLKCLIFIPVISRTYCDPKSFAWEHEFKAFVEMASKDNLGLKIKLQDGNVSGRVLPVQIHDLDTDDKRIIENVLGGFIRGIEFIYKEPGVDRPLKPRDNEEKNLYKASYQNQVNKAALAIKEIISAIKHQNQQNGGGLKEDITPLHPAVKNRNTTFILGSVAALIFILALIFIPKTGQPSEHTEKSLAVLPFRNDSPDPENEYFCNGMMEEILNQLQKISDLKVKARTSVEKYRNPDKDIRAIGKELGVSLILEGSVRKIADDIRITAQLIDAKTGDHLWSDTYDGKYTTKIFDFQSGVAKKVASSLNAVITPQEEIRIDAKPTTQMLAYDLKSRGSEMIRKFRYTHDSSLIRIALNLFDQASEIDTAYTGTFGSKALAYIEIGNYDSAIYYCRKSMARTPENNASYYNNMGRIYSLLNQPDSAFKYVQIAVDLAPNSCWTNLLMGQLYSQSRNEIIKALPYYQKAYDNDGESAAEVNTNIAMEFILIGDYQKALEYYRKALILRTECPIIMSYCTMLFAQGKKTEALHSLDSACSIAPCDQICDMARFYFYLLNDEPVQAEECFLKAVNAGYKQNDSDAAFIASLYKITGKNKEAAEIAAKSIELNKSMMSKDMRIGMIAYRTFKLACASAVLDDNQSTIKYLSEYERLGFFYWNHMIRSFPGFSTLRDDPEFKAIIKRIDDKQASLREKVRQMEMRGEITL